MSSLIEQAAKRLEQLRRAGAEIPAPSPSVANAGPGAFPAEPPKGVRSAAPVASGQVSQRVEIDFHNLVAAGIVSPDAPRSHVADQYRVIKRPLIDNAMGKGPAKIEKGNLIMVTSSLPGEGKSFTAINLAMSIATELDNTVMLVDADVARPSILRVLGLPQGPGLLDMLLDDAADLSSMLLKTNIDKLSILPSGTPHPRATEMLASDAMTRLLDDMANRYSDRIIVFDSPPLLLTTEARVLASHMGQVVMVIQSEKTLRSDVQDALAMIEDCQVKLLVLNQARNAMFGGYGQRHVHGYGYGYGYGYGPKPSASEPASV